MNAEMSSYSQILWMKLLLSLLPSSPPVLPESRLAQSLNGTLDTFLCCCVDILPRLKHVRASGPYQPEYDEDEETIDAGHERYRAILRLSESKVRRSYLIFFNVITQSSLIPSFTSIKKHPG